MMSTRLSLVARLGLAAIAGMAFPGTVDAEVRASTEFHAYIVGGTTPGALVSYMRRRPFPGDYGPAVANIRPHYILSVDTTYGDAVCAVKNVDLAVKFVITVPQARSPGAFSPATWSAWSNFIDFATRHEETHRSIYVDCADDFAAKVPTLVASDCAKLRATIASLFKAANRACERRQLAFDRGEYRKVLRLGLFSGGGSAKRKPAPVRSGFFPSSAMGAPSR